MRRYLLLSLLSLVLAQNSSDCECYAVEGTSGGFYTTHDFFDFRNIDDGGNYNAEPANVTDSQNKGAESTQAGFLSSTSFTNAFSVQNWGRPSTSDKPITLQNSPQNVYIKTKDDDDNSSDAQTHLTLRAYRSEDFTSTAEVENARRNLLYGSFRVRARIRGDPGTVAGIFTYGTDTAELDIEVLSRDPTSLIRYTNQPDVDKNGNTVSQAESDITLPNNLTWDEWHEHRIDWSNKLVTYYIDGIELVKKSYSVPKVPQYLDLNMWSDGGSWSGNMSVGSAAYLEVEYIEMVFNTTKKNAKRSLMKRKAKSCTVICGVDGVASIGTPEVLYLGKASRFGDSIMVSCICAALVGAFFAMA